MGRGSAECDPLSSCPQLIMVALTSMLALFCVSIGLRCVSADNADATFSTMTLQRAGNGLKAVRRLGPRSRRHTRSLATPRGARYPAWRALGACGSRAPPSRSAAPSRVCCAVALAEALYCTLPPLPAARRRTASRRSTTTTASSPGAC